MVVTIVAIDRTTIDTLHKIGFDILNEAQLLETVQNRLDDIVASGDLDDEVVFVFEVERSSDDLNSSKMGPMYIDLVSSDDDENEDSSSLNISSSSDETDTASESEFELGQMTGAQVTSEHNYCFRYTVHNDRLEQEVLTRSKMVRAYFQDTQLED